MAKCGMCIDSRNGALAFVGEVRADEERGHARALLLRAHLLPCTQVIPGPHR